MKMNKKGSHKEASLSVVSMADVLAESLHVRCILVGFQNETKSFLLFKLLHTGQKILQSSNVSKKDGVLGRFAIILYPLAMHG